jgi:hypothetical protein
MEFSRGRGRKQGGHISEATFRDISVEIFRTYRRVLGGPIDVMSLRVS